MAWKVPNEFNPVFYRRYVDYIIVLFESAEHLSKFHAYVSTCHPNIYFSFEQETIANLSLLDVEVSQQQEIFVETIYRKPSFSGIVPTLHSCNATYAFQSESTLHSCLIVKELLAWNRHEI